MFLNERLPVVVILTLCMSGCTSLSKQGPLWPRIQSAAVDAAKQKSVWVPLLSAVAVGVTNADDGISDWANDHTPLFGSATAAADASTYLVKGLMISAFVTSLMAEPDHNRRFKRIAVNGLAVSVNHRVSSGIKDLAKRERPNGLSDQSFPSLHSSNAFTAAEITSRNLALISLNERQHRYLNTGLYALASSTAWARVEAGVHYPSDVLAGAALGSFIAGLFNEAFLRTDSSVVLSFQAMQDGGAVTLYWEPYR